MTEILKAGDPKAPVRAAEVLAGGGVVIYPTETLYGIGALATLERSVERVFELKGRPRGKPLPALARDLDMMGVYAVLTPLARELVARFMPGPLTLVLAGRGGLPDALTAGTGTVALRISANPFVKELFKLIDVPLVSTSANTSGGPDLHRACEVIEAFRDRVELIIDSGNLSPSHGSTVLDLSTGTPRIVREGVLKRSALEPWLEKTT